MTKELFHPDATHPFPIAVWKNNNWAPGQPCIQFGFGIGQRSVTQSLEQAAAWAILGATSGTSLAMACDQFGFNIVAVQFANIAQFGEIDYATQFAIDYLQADPNQIALINHSQSGYNYAAWVNLHPDSPKKYATITMSAMGPRIDPGTAKALADSGRPILFVTSLLDHDKDASGIGTNSGTSYVWTENLYKQVIAAGGTAWLTEYKNVDHNGVLSAIVSAWNLGNGVPGNWSWITPGLANGMNNPVCTSWYDWILSNALNAPVRGPMDAAPQTAAQTVDPIPVDSITDTQPIVDPVPSPVNIATTQAPTTVTMPDAPPVPVTLTLLDYWVYPAPGKVGQQLLHTWWSDDPTKLVIVGPLTLDGLYRINGVHRKGLGEVDLLCVNMADAKQPIVTKTLKTRSSDDTNWY